MCNINELSRAELIELRAKIIIRLACINMGTQGMEYIFTQQLYDPLPHRLTNYPTDYLITLKDKIHTVKLEYKEDDDKPNKTPFPMHGKDPNKVFGKGRR